MKRKSSLAVGPRTRQNMLKGKNIRTLPDGGDRFEDYWSSTDDESSPPSPTKKSDLSSTFPEKSFNVESSNLSQISNKENCSFRKKTNHSPVIVHLPQEVLSNDPVNVDEVQNLNKETADTITSTINLGDKNFQTEASDIVSDLKNKDCRSSLAVGPRTRQDMLKDKIIRKLPDGGDIFEDYWTDTDGRSSILSKKSSVSSKLPKKSLNVEPSNLIEISGERNCSIRKKAIHSPLKFQEVLSDDPVNSDEIQNASKETCAVGIENITVNLGIDGKNLQADTDGDEALGTLDNQSTNNLFPELEKNSSPVVQEIQSIDSFPLSQTCNKNDKMLKCISRKSLKSSRKSTSKFNKLNAKLVQTQFQYDEFDEKIMEMVQINNEKQNESTNISVASENEMRLNLLTSSPRKTKERSQVEEKTINSSGKIQGEKNMSYNGSHNHNLSSNRSNKINRKSQSNLELESFKNVNMNENVLKCKKSKQESVNSKDTPQLTMKTSKTFISKKSPIGNKSYNVDSSSDSHTNDVLTTDKMYHEVHAKEKQKTNKRSSFIPDENILETADFDDSSHLQISKRQKTSANKKNSSTSEGNDNVSAPMNLSKSSVKNVSKINKKTTGKSRKIENNEKGHLYDKNIDDQHSSKREVSKNSASLNSNPNKAHTEMKHAVHVRKSSRKKYCPLAHWRNERLLYRFEDGEIITLGIDKGTRDDLGALQQLTNIIQTRKNRKAKKIMKPKKAKILDVIEEKEKSICVLKKFPLVDWEGPINHKAGENSMPDYQIKRMIQTKRNHFGYLQIAVGKTKQTQYMPEEDLQLTLIDGTVEVHFQKQVYVLERRDMFILPKSSAYSITNIGNRKALLSFAVGKFNFFDNC